MLAYMQFLEMDTTVTSGTYNVGDIQLRPV